MVKEYLRADARSPCFPTPGERGRIRMGGGPVQLRKNKKRKPYRPRKGGLTNVGPLTSKQEGF
ncbi:hypothetical protein OIU78_014739 [Salix suchowensis]|jgi:hypothetical protein|nr:hypothetical protein OIU78_014739 [Salix suchowensis]